MFSQWKKFIAAGVLLGSQLTVQAEDIDLFVGATPAADTEVPNVLLVIDNTANWNQAFTNEMAALYTTLSGLAEGKFRVGMMMFTETGQGNGNVDGAYVRAAIRLMNASNKSRYLSLINSIGRTTDDSNGGKVSLAMAEAYRYFSGGAPRAGNDKNKTDYTGNTSGTAQDNAVYALTGNALASRNATQYVSPITASCQKNYIIYISNGPAQDNTNDLTASRSMLTAAGGSATTIPISPSGSQENLADEWARFMKQSQYGIVTYTVDVDPETTGQGPGWTALLKSMANVSSGKYFAVSSGNGGAQIEEVLRRTFSEIQAVNSVFAAVSLPVSVNTQGTYLNQVYVGMFRPDPDGYPRWAGNLKQYRMGFDNGVLRLLDATRTAAINNQTGFVAECARSFWTPSSVDSYWSFQPQGDCSPPPGTAEDYYRNSNSPDGNIVEKGAQAYGLRASTARNMKTCSASFASCTALTDFNTANTGITQAALGAASATEREELINWARGLDLNDENLNGTTSGEMRPSIHGDVVHSRPVAINYGTDAAPQVVVFYGGNDGALRAINGNRDTAISGVAAGGELWSFMPPEFYSRIKRIRANTDLISFPNSAGGTPKNYGFDGPITALKHGSSTWLYATMRRGGRVLYAFDVTTAGAPSLKWKVGCPNLANDTDCTSGFSAIGQTWSSPRSMTASGYGGGTSPLLVMGGGYDACEDSDPHTCTASSKGNRIFVLDANTGSLVRALETDRAVVGDITIVRDGATGHARYLYATDTGGNIYRAAIGAALPADWTVTKIAALGCATPTACAASRKFLYAPNVVEEANGVFIVMAGSGDREKPLSYYSSAYNTTNYYFMVKDKPSDATWLTLEATTCGSSVICLDSLFHITNSTTPTAAQLATKKGWALRMAAHEQVVTSAITLVGVVTFSTHQPAIVQAGSCGSNLGTAQVYNIRYLDAAPAEGTSRYATISGGGLPPSPVGGKVTLDAEDGGKTVPFIIGSRAASPLEAHLPTINTATGSNQTKNRIYWYIQR